MKYVYIHEDVPYEAYNDDITNHNKKTGEFCYDGFPYQVNKVYEIIETAGGQCKLKGCEADPTPWPMPSDSEFLRWATPTMIAKYRCENEN